MVKLILYGAVALLSAVGMIAALLWWDGKLSPETMQAITDKEAYNAKQAAMMEDSTSSETGLGTLAKQLNDREKQLIERGIALDERDKQLSQREADLEKARTDLEMLQKSIDASEDAATESRKTQLKTVAITLENMEPESAAERLETFPPDESAEILLSITEKKRGAILEAMSNEISARVITEILNSGS